MVKKHTVLIVSHHSQILRLNALILKKAGYWVRTEQDPKEALTLLLKQKVDLLLLDLDIPQFDAYAFTRQLMEKQRKTMTIVFSRRSKSQINEQYTRYFLYTTFGFIFCPFTKNDLLNRFEQVTCVKMN